MHKIFGEFHQQDKIAKLNTHNNSLYPTKA